MRFRVFFENGYAPDIEAENADEARAIAAAKMKEAQGRVVRISKVKVVKEPA